MACLIPLKMSTRSKVEKDFVNKPMGISNVYMWNEFEGKAFVPLIVAKYNNQIVNIDADMSPTDLRCI